MKTLEKALELLFLLARSSGPLGVDAIAAELGMPRSTAYRFIRTLQRRHLVDASSGDGKYHLGIKVLELYQGLLNLYSLRAAALPFLQALTARTGNTSYLCIESDHLAVCVESVESPEGLISRLGVGRTLPLHAGAAAKVLLAHLPEAEQREVLRGKLVRFTKFTVTNRRRLREELGRIRRDGYSYTNQEVDPGSRAVGVPVCDFSGKVVAALGIAGPMHKFQDGQIREIVAIVKDHGRMISEKLGFSAKELRNTLEDPASDSRFPHRHRGVL